MTDYTIMDRTEIKENDDVIYIQKNPDTYKIGDRLITIYKNKYKHFHKVTGIGKQFECPYSEKIEQRFYLKKDGVVEMNEPEIDQFKQDHQKYKEELELKNKLFLEKKKEKTEISINYHKEKRAAFGFLSTMALNLEDAKKGNSYCASEEAIKYIENSYKHWGAPAVITVTINNEIVCVTKKQQEALGLRETPAKWFSQQTKGENENATRKLSAQVSVKARER